MAIPSAKVVQAATKQTVVSRAPTYVLGADEKAWLERTLGEHLKLGNVGFTLPLKQAYELFNVTDDVPAKIGKEDRISYGMQRALQRAGLPGVSIGKSLDGASLVFRSKRKSRKPKVV